MYERNIVVSRNEYEKEDEYWNRVRDTLKMLIKNDFRCIVTDEDRDILRFDFTEKDDEFCDYFPYMLDCVEGDIIDTLRAYREDGEDWEPMWLSQEERIVVEQMRDGAQVSVKTTNIKPEDGVVYVNEQEKE